MEGGRTTDPVAGRLLAMVGALVEPQLAAHRQATADRLARLNGVDGTAHREARSRVKQQALSERAAMIVGELLATHRSTRASLSTAMRSRCTTWAVDQIFREAKRINGGPALEERLRDEFAAATAAIERQFSTLAADSAERMLRRLLAALRRTVPARVR